MVGLRIIQDLMNKAREIFQDHFARLGIYNKVLLLAKLNTVEEEDDAKDKVSTQKEDCLN